MSTATPTAQSHPTREDAERFLAGVDGWIWSLAHKNAERVRMTPADLFHEIVVDVVLNLSKYDAGRGAPTTWTTWRARHVVMKLRRKRGRFASAIPFSQLSWGNDPDAGDPVDALAVARPDPDTEGGRVERQEREEEVGGAVRDAVAGLPWAQRRAIELVYGIGRAPIKGRKAMAEATGVTHQAVHLALQSGRAKLRAVEELQELASEHGLG